MTTRYFGQRINATKTPPAHRAGPVYRRRALARHVARGFLRSDHAHARITQHRHQRWPADVARRGRRLHRRGPGRLLEARPAAGLAAADPGHRLHTAHAGAPGQGQSAPRGRSDGHGRGREPLHRRGRRRRRFSSTIEPLPAVVDLEEALAPDAPLVHDDLEQQPGSAHVVQNKGDYEASRGRRPIWSSVAAFYYDRGTAAAMENRGIVADWDAQNPAA